MAEKISFVLDDDNYKKLVGILGKQIKESKKSYSFSKVIRDTLRKNLK